MYLSREFLSLVHDFAKQDAKLMSFRSALIVNGSTGKFQFESMKINEVKQRQRILLRIEPSADELECFEQLIDCFPALGRTIKRLNEITLPFGVDLMLNSSKIGRVNAYAKIIA